MVSVSWIYQQLDGFIYISYIYIYVYIGGPSRRGPGKVVKNTLVHIIQKYNTHIYEIVYIYTYIIYTYTLLCNI